MNILQAAKQAAQTYIKDKLGKTTAEFASDVFNAGIVDQNLPTQVDTTVVLGYILETCPVAHAYKVAIAGARSPILCCALQTGGGNPSLVFDSSLYSVGCSVLVSLHQSFGIILGAVPLEGTGNDLIVGNRTSGSSRNYPEPSDKTCLEQATEDHPDVGIRQFGHGLPMDSTDVGEFGHTTLTGVKMMLNPFMALMAVDDYSGLWMFDEDSLVRLSGLNLQVRSSGSEHECLNDDGEYLDYKGSVTYPWEQLGFTKDPTTESELIEETPVEEWRDPDTWKSFAEPREEKVKPFHRVAEYCGFLGQGKYTQIVAPDPEKEWTKFGEKENQRGLVRDTKTIDGWISSVSANGTYIGKRGIIPSVTRVQRPDDTSTKVGDNPTNYHKTNEFNAKSEIEGNNAPMEKVMGLEDSIAYQQNYKELLPFLQHKEDYYVPEDSDLNEGYHRYPDFNKLHGEHIISVDEGPEVTILQGSSNARKIKVSPAESGIACLSDGSQVLYGGCGEEVRMTGGSIFMDAPGDIWLKAGRRIILWGGDDIEIRAKGSMDISTTEEGIRIKAEGKLSMLGGNNYRDGVLIESKGSTTQYDFNKGGDEDKFGGILLKSQDGIIGAMGATIYLRSGTGTGGEGIFFDAGNGDQSIYAICNSVENYVADTFNINFANVKTGTVDATDQFKKDKVSLNGDTLITGKLNIGDSVIVGTDIYAINHIFTGNAKEHNLFVGDWSLDKRDKKSKLEQQVITTKSDLAKNAKDKYDLKITENLASEAHIANEETVENVGFTFRNSKEYDLQNNFAVYEARWQNIASNNGRGINAWEEKPVVNAKYEESYPFPGKDAFTSEQCYVTQKWNLVDYYTGAYKDRKSGEDIADGYKNPKYAEQERKLLNEYNIL